MDSEHLEAYLADELDDKGREQVRHALRNDGELRERFLVQMQMDAALGAILSAEEGKERFEAGVLAQLDSEGAGDQRGFAKSVLTEIVEERENIVPIQWPDMVKACVVSAAAAIALMFVLQSIIFSTARPETEEGETKKFLARVERSEGLQWSDKSEDKVREDGWLTDGLLEIESGTAMIAFNSGAAAIVEGPARLSLESNNRAFLQTGRLTAEVPPAASGFTINTPRLNAVDIGTRFGIAVDPNGDTELHVMEGVVEASRTSGNTTAILLEEGSALRADERTLSELRPVEYAGENFTLRVGSPTIPQPALRYDFDEAGGEIEDSGTDRLYHIPLIGAGGMENSPRRSAGRSGSGLIFDSGDSLSVDLSREFRMEAPHTVAFWVKIPPRFGRENNEVIARFGGEGEGWEISANLNSSHGSRGALRIDHRNGRIVGSTDIADGNWHHVAYRFIGGDAADIASHVHLFVDGHPESISESVGGPVRSGYLGTMRLGGMAEGLEGWIDDLMIFREAVPTTYLQTLSD